MALCLPTWAPSTSVFRRESNRFELQSRLANVPFAACRVPASTPIKLIKKKIEFVPLGEALGPAANPSINPFKGVTRNATKQLMPAITLCVLGELGAESVAECDPY